MKSCFFIGHREAPVSLAPYVAEAIERHIVESGVEEFVVGGYGAFDRIVLRQLADAKKRHPEIHILLLTPYHPAENGTHWPGEGVGSYYPPGMESVPKRAAIVRANRYVLEHSDYLIAYVWHPASNARELLDYARSLEAQGRLHTENLAERFWAEPSEQAPFPAPAEGSPPG